MIIAQDLKIKNIVTLSEDVRREMHINEIHALNDFFTVETIYSDNEVALKLDDEVVDLAEKDIEPLEINADWLLKLGFEKKKQPGRLYDYYYIKNGLYFSFIDFHRLVYKNKALEDVKCTYVHQLQNLYYSLSGTELVLIEA